jgi:hypothetical protein
VSEPRPFTGVVEALPPEEWAVRLRISLDHFRKNYRGPVARIGANVRIYSADIHDWLGRLTGAESSGEAPDPWGGVGDAEKGALSRRKSGQAA